MKISVVIPTLNRSELLCRTLNSLCDQTFSKEDFEVIIVDNGSTDSTKDIAYKYSDSLSLKYILEPSPGLHNGRHVGLKMAKSEILVFADDDIEAFPSWIDTIFENFQNNPNVVLVGGKNLPKYEVHPPFWIMEMWNKIGEFGHVIGELSILDFGNIPMEISPYYVFGCNFSIRKKILMEAGGFHPDGMPFDLIKFRGDGETHVSKYISDNGYRALYDPGASVFHYVNKERITIEYFCRRRYAQGISDAYTFLRSNNAKKVNEKHYIIELLQKLLGIKQYQILLQIRQELRLSDIEKKFRESYDNGYQYLVAEYNRDEVVRNWVHRDNYFN